MSEEKKCRVCEKILLVGILICSLVSAIYSVKTDIALSNGGTKKAAKVEISKSYAKNQTLEKAKETGKPTIVLFYADWCGYCQRFAPVFHSIVKTRKFKSKLAVAYVNGTLPENSQYMQEYQIEGFPTVYMVNFETGEKVKLNNGLLFTPDAKNVLLEKFVNFASKK